MTTASGAVEKYSNGDLFKVDDIVQLHFPMSSTKA